MNFYLKYFLYIMIIFIVLTSLHAYYINNKLNIQKNILIQREKEFNTELIV